MPAWVRVLLLLLAAWATAYAVLLLGYAEAAGLPELDPASWWPIGALGLASAVVCGMRVAAVREERLVWTLLAVAMASWGCGFLAWAALYEDDASPPYPSVADAFWLPLLLALLVAVVLLLRAERPRLAATAWLDALIPALTVAALASQVLLPNIGGGHKPFAEAATLLAYPVIDIALITLVVLVLSLRRWEPGPRWTLLTVAVLGSVLGDFLWSYLVAAGEHQVGAAADVPYVLTPVAMAWAAWAPADPVARHEDDRLTLAAPALSAFCALGLLFYGAITADLILVSLVLALVAVAAGVVRWSLALRREAQSVVLRDVAVELARKAEQQAAVAELGRRAIATADVDELMGRATGVIASILDADRVAVLELAPDRKRVLRRADSRGDAPTGDLEPIGLAALQVGSPSVRTATALCARIEGKDGCWGAIAVLNRDARGFADDDVSFVRAVANVLAAVNGRAREEQLEAQLQQSRRLESVGKLAGGVAHDFNNLLAVILNYAEFAREAATDDAQRRDLVELSKAAVRGTDLVKQLLQFSRRRTAEAAAVDLADVLRETEPMLRQSIGAHIDFRCRVRAELPPTVMDPNQVAQVLVNLAVNARDAMPDGGTLTVEATSVGGAVRLVVADTGGGMSAETAAKAFDPFFTTKPPGWGTGLGLATVYGIVTQAGGTVELDSEPGRGTRVVIELPVAEGAAVPATPEEHAAPSAGTGTGETILVVEDNDQVRRVACRILRSNGYRVLEATGGAQGLEVAAQVDRELDMLLSDVVMPGMGGVELAERMRRGRPSLRVLHMSGYTSLPDPSAAPPELILKPFTADELLARVRSVLGEPELSAAL